MNVFISITSFQQTQTVLLTALNFFSLCSIYIASASSFRKHFNTNERGDHERRIQFSKLPRILNVHLPRVRWNRTTSESYVDASEMRFDTELYMGEHVSGVTVPAQYLDLKNEFKQISKTLYNARSLLPGYDLVTKQKKLGIHFFQQVNALETSETSEKSAQSTQTAQTASTASTAMNVEEWYTNLEQQRTRVLQVITECVEKCSVLRNQIHEMRSEIFTNDVYSLHAIVFHRGANDRPSGGHYYVYIRDDSEKEDGEQEERWLRFDDDKVTVCACTTAELMARAYGGSSHGNGADGKMQDGTMKDEKLKDGNKHDCARTLVYLEKKSQHSMSDEIVEHVLMDRLNCPKMYAPSECSPVVAVETLTSTKEEGKVKDEIKTTTEIQKSSNEVPNGDEMQSMKGKEEPENYFGNTGILSRCISNNVVVKQELMDALRDVENEFNEQESCRDGESSTR